MPSNDEKARRKAIAREIAQKQRARTEAAMPISRDDLADLFDYLDVALEAGCDHSLRLTSLFFQARNLSEDLIVPWLREYGGHCDCEVLANVEDVFEP